MYLIDFFNLKCINKSSYEIFLIILFFLFKTCLTDFNIYFIIFNSSKNQVKQTSYHEEFQHVVFT